MDTLTADMKNTSFKFEDFHHQTFLLNFYENLILPGRSLFNFRGRESAEQKKNKTVPSSLGTSGFLQSLGRKICW